MATQTLESREKQPVRQFSIFTENRMGRLHDLMVLFNSNNVHVLAVTALDTTDSTILRLVVDDPDRTRNLLRRERFPFTESDLLVVEIRTQEDFRAALAALLEAEINLHYLYPFILRPNGKSAVAFSAEDLEIAVQALVRHQLNVLTQNDLSR